MDNENFRELFLAERALKQVAEASLQTTEASLQATNDKLQATNDKLQVLLTEKAKFNFHPLCLEIDRDTYLQMAKDACFENFDRIQGYKSQYDNPDSSFAYDRSTERSYRSMDIKTISLSDFRRSMLFGTESEIHVKQSTFDFSKIESIIAKKLFECDFRRFQTFLNFEIEALNLFRSSLGFLHSNRVLTEKKFQTIFIKYLTGLSEKFQNGPFTASVASNMLLSGAVNLATVNDQSNKESMERILIGYSDVMICNVGEVEHFHERGELLQDSIVDEKFVLPPNLESIVELKPIFGDLYRSKAWQPKDQLIGQLECISNTSIKYTFYLFLT
jgi:hypothetical protein